MKTTKFDIPGLDYTERQLEYLFTGLFGTKPNLLGKSGLYVKLGYNSSLLTATRNSIKVEGFMQKDWENYLEFWSDNYKDSARLSKYSMACNLLNRKVTLPTGAVGIVTGVKVHPKLLFRVQKLDVDQEDYYKIFDLKFLKDDF